MPYTSSPIETVQNGDRGSSSHVCGQKDEEKDLDMTVSCTMSPEMMKTFDRLIEKNQLVAASIHDTKYGITPYMIGAIQYFVVE
jgi:hypothetical protein